MSQASFKWPHAWETDERKPIFQFTVNNHSYDLFAPSAMVWTEMAGLTIIMLSWLALLSIPVYKYLVNNARTTTAYLIGWGLLVPACMIVPTYIFDAIGVIHKYLRFILVLVSPTSMFRTIEAMYGFCPPHITASWKEFAIYFASPLVYRYDKKNQQYIKPTWSDVIKQCFSFAQGIVVASAFYSCFFVFPSVFPSLGHAHDKIHLFNPTYIFNPITLKDGALYALLFQIFLAVSSKAIVILSSVLIGRETVPLMDNPMLKSTSASDFWGRRWNTLIHASLKQGVYKPVKYLGASHGVAVLATFFVSGLFHEWIMPIVMSDYNYTVGSSMLFFLWQGIVIVLERHTQGFGLPKHLARPLLTFCIVMLGLPPSPWFCDAYVNSNFFVYSGSGMFVIKPTQLARVTE
jgi:Membrane bound O-acyl transferase family